MHTLSASDLNTVSFMTPPRNMGQIVNVSYGLYGLYGEYLCVCRILDSSTGTVTYYTAPIGEDEEFEPWQCEPSVEGDYTPLTITR